MEWLYDVIKVLQRVSEYNVVVGDVVQNLIIFLGGFFGAKKLAGKTPPPEQ